MIQVKREWFAQVEDVLGEGIIWKEAPDAKLPFPSLISTRQYGKVLDKKIFKGLTTFKKGDVISVSIENVESSEKQEEYGENYVWWISTVYHVDELGFYTKEAGKNRFSDVFFYQSRTMIIDDIYLNNRLSSKNNPYEKGDIVKIRIERL